MNYEDFIKEYIEKLQDMLKQQVQEEKLKIHYSETENKVHVRYAETDYQVAYVIDLYEKFEEFLKKREMDSILRESVYRISQERSNVSQLYEAVQNIDTNNFRLVPLGMKTKEQLKEFPHTMVEDMPMGVRYNVPSVGGSVLVKNDFCSLAHLTGAEMLEQAKRNLEKEQFLLQDMETMLLQMAKNMGMDEEFALEMQQQTPSKSMLYVLTNAEKREGASFVASKTALKSVKERLGEDFYILPSSRHELIIIPQSQALNLEYMQSMVREINITQVEERDRLSDSIYRCDGKKISLVNLLEKERSIDMQVPQHHMKRGR